MTGAALRAMTAIAPIGITATTMDTRPNGIGGALLPEADNATLLRAIMAVENYLVVIVAGGRRETMSGRGGKDR